jgi:hypothetical protein
MKVRKKVGQQNSSSADTTHTEWKSKKKKKKKKNHRIWIVSSKHFGNSMETAFVAIVYFIIYL